MTTDGTSTSPTPRAALLFLGRPLPSLRISLIAVALGATTYAAASATYLASIERMGAGPAGVVSYCYPMLVMAGAIMLDTNAENRRDNVLLDASASVTASRAECGR